MSFLAHACLFVCIALLAAWALATLVTELRPHAPRPSRHASLATRLQIATLVALALTCLSLLALGGRTRARWTFFMLLALPVVAVSLWASVRLLLHERRDRGNWPSILPGR